MKIVEKIASWLYGTPPPPAAPKNYLIRKEIRLLLPAWTIAMLLAIVPVWVFSIGQPGLHDDFRSFFQSWRNIFSQSFFVLELGALILCLVPFGREFSAKTFTLALTQPAPRKRLWRIKVSLLSLSLLLSFIAFVASTLVSFKMRMAPPSSAFEFFRLPFQIVALSLLIVFSGALWTTLLVRQVIAAAALTLIAPAALFMGLIWVGEGRVNPKKIMDFVDAGLFVYSIAGFFFARWLFLRAQDLNSCGKSISLPRFSGLTKRLSRSRRFLVIALLQKELQLQQVNWLFAAGFALIQTVVLVSEKLSSKPFGWVDGLWIIWLAMPAVAGCLAVSEERRLGTMQGNICLPVARPVRFAAKFIVSLCVGLFLGIIAPWVMGKLTTAAGFQNPFFWETPVFKIGAITAGMWLISFYASTLTCNSLHAIGFTIVLILAGAMGWNAVPFNSASDINMNEGQRMLLAGVVVLVLLPTLLCLAYKNFQSIEVSRTLWVRNIVALVLAVLFANTATAAIRHRVWESFMPLEPHHGTATIPTGTAPAKVFCHAGGFALLPDGRLWTGIEYKQSVERGFDQAAWTILYKDSKSVEISTLPQKGMFLGGSNWIDLAVASATYDAAAIQSDGTLWSIFQTNRLYIGIHATTLDHSEISPALLDQDLRGETLRRQPLLKQIGTDSDWKKVVAGRFHLLALKTDGTLWGWGMNYNGQLGQGPKLMTNGPVRIGRDSDWVNIFADGDTSIGIKQDGSIWKWGIVRTEPTPKSPSSHHLPVRSSFTGTNWISFSSSAFDDLAIRSDGTMWFAGRLPFSLFGIRLQGPADTESPMRVGSASNWLALAVEPYGERVADDAAGFVGGEGLAVEPLGYGERVALMRNGALTAQNAWFSSWKPSRYSDWIAVDGGGLSVVALASDGTLSCWRNSFSLLAPSHVPIWSVNIFK